MKLEIGRRSRRCSACSTGFETGRKGVSVLLTAGEALERRDTCESCYQPDPGELANWRFTLSAQKKGLRICEDAIWQVIAKAKADEELRAKPFTYILCLMLARKRKLRRTQSRRKQGREVHTYTNLSRGVDLEVPVPLLTPPVFARLQRELVEFLSAPG